MMEESVTYHDPCHLKKSLGVAAEPRAGIKASGKRLVEMEGSDKCCGMGGSFNLYHYNNSSKIGNLKQKNIADTGCTQLPRDALPVWFRFVTCSQRRGLDIKVRHPLELYADSLRKKKLI